MAIYILVLNPAQMNALLFQKRQRSNARDTVLKKLRVRKARQERGNAKLCGELEKFKSDSEPLKQLDEILTAKIRIQHDTIVLVNNEMEAVVQLPTDV